MAKKKSRKAPAFKSREAAYRYADRRARLGYKVHGVGYNDRTGKYEVKWSRANPSRRITKSTIWMSARRVKVVKRGRHIGLLIEKPPPKRKREKTKGRK